MLKKALFFIGLSQVFFVLLGYGQKSVLIQGTVKSLNKDLLPYVNIAIPNQSTGTVSNEFGEFTLNLQQVDGRDTLVFSCVGFHTLKMPIYQILNENITSFELRPKLHKLKEVSIVATKTRVKKIGTKSHNPFLFTFTSQDPDRFDSREFAKFVKIKQASKVESAHLLLNLVSGDTALIRINFYQSKNGLPGERLIEDKIIVKTAIKKGWLKIDLSEFNITLTQDFFIGYELLPLKKVTGKISLGNQFGGWFYSRTTSLGPWDAFYGASLSSYLILKL